MLDNATDVVTIRVEVNAPVIVSHSPDYQIAFEGDTVKMSCAANGIPEPSISWAFNKTREEFIDFHSHLWDTIQSSHNLTSMLIEMLNDLQDNGRQERRPGHPRVDDRQRDSV